MASNPKTTELSQGLWAIDPVHSAIQFSVQHLVVSRIHGNFERFTGAITVTPNGTPAVTAEIAVDSVYTGNPQRDGHIKSAEFFDTDRFPTATFKSTDVDRKGDGYAVTGDFTLRGVTRPVTLALVFNGTSPGTGQGEVAGFEVSGTLNRKDFGIAFEMPLPAGGAVVGDEVLLRLSIEAVKQA